MPAAPRLIPTQAVPDPGTLLIVGSGSIGRRHLANLRALGRCEAVLLRATERPLLVAPPVRVERDLESALAHHPQAALVCNPTAFHVPMALAVLRAGCHLFLEKPLSHSLEGIGALHREAAARGLVVLVGYHFRFHPGLVQVRKWLDEGVIGEVVSARAHWGEFLPGWHPEEDYRNSYSARADLGGGVVLTLSHPFDYLRFLLGEVESVSADVGRAGGLEIDVEDTAHVRLRFASGALATVTLNYLERPPSHTLHLVGRRGSVDWCGRSGVARLSDSEGCTVGTAPPPDGFERNTMFRDEMRHFLACVAGAERPRCTLSDGERALRIALAALRSAGTGRSVDV